MILINLPRVKHIVDYTKNGRGIIPQRVFNGSIQNIKKEIPQNSTKNQKNPSTSWKALSLKTEN